ncbi:hypothetical protein V8G57_02615 [Collimonas sp. H4R21]|uniref:N-acetyltransferase domain-containing protein n=1 Tax=Collimonas rhizosphaerae TaxID=3126357 RepID=A0ABU9PQJ1_9BURK
MTLEELRALVDSVELDLPPQNLAEKGSLVDRDGRTADFSIHRGWNITLSHACDKHWREYNLALMKFIDDQKYDDRRLKTVLAGIQIDDAHWDWLLKSSHYRTDEYKWLFLVADGKPQGACLIYHPKASVLSAGDIFYIEYIAVAPWNRSNPMESRLFKAVGSILIKHLICYAHSELKLRYGFSLHALPRAIGYYQKLGMVGHTLSDKAPLKYFEMTEDCAANYVAGL